MYAKDRKLNYHYVLKGGQMLLFHVLSGQQREWSKIIKGKGEQSGSGRK